MRFDKFLNAGVAWTTATDLMDGLSKPEVPCSVCAGPSVSVFAWCHPNPNHDYGNVYAFCAVHGPDTRLPKTSLWNVEKDTILALFGKSSYDGQLLPIENLGGYLLAISVMEG